jgi:integrase/recombinase XerC
MVAENALTLVQSPASPAPRPTLPADLFGRFLGYLDAAPKTVETYTKALRRLFAYFSLHGIAQPRREDLIAFREDLKASGRKPSTVQGYMAAARIFFRWAAQEGLYPNIAERVKGAKQDRAHKKDYLTSAQVKAILEGIGRVHQADLRDYAMVALMVTCGLRTVEVVRADVGDLRTLGDGTVLYVQGKGHEEKAEYVKVAAPVEKAIRAYLATRGPAADAAPLFSSGADKNRGQRLTTRSISRIAKDRMRAAGYDSARLTAHSLRHTAVTLSLLAGKDLAEVQQFARHTNISTTLIYDHSLELARNSCAQAVTEAVMQ